MRGRIRDLAPACFAPVMATGIVSRALALAGARGAANALLVVAVALYVPLFAAAAVRAVRHGDRVRAELRDPRRLFGHYTFVAASDVLASRLAATPVRPVAAGLCALAALVWVALAVATARLPRSALAAADGTWFLATVGLQSLVIALTSVRPGLVAAVPLWACGVLLYAATLTVVVRGLLRRPPAPAGLTPAYWITMGAAAISALAGSQLSGGSPLLPGAAVTGAVAALWAWATLLIPALVAAGVWRHGLRRVPLVYEPALWCVVFPLGMYATATAQVTTGHGAHPLTPAVSPLAWTALVAWLAVQHRLVAARVRAAPP
ncbi:tellurite resistance/C4-dicarboxylate transporter family protein [Streptomyces sp. G45]|uniref:tellurite resistance/C4-dicarboxylate transporter family protein n=1 Tax=Streptomyces sp. G45 TaxID=3406627 RepID=UPI003C14F371